MTEETLKSEIINIEVNKTIDDGFINDENDLEILNLLQNQINNDMFLLYNHDAFAMLKSKNNMNLLSKDKEPNYLGYLSLHKDYIDVDLNIRSKYSSNNHLLNYLLSKVYDFDGEMINDDNSGFNYLVFVNAYRNAIKKGVFRKYIEVECNDSKIKGKIDVARHIAVNQSIQGKVAYSTREYSSKNNVNRLILKTYLLLNRRNEKLLRRAINNNRDITKSITQLKNIISNVDEYTNEQVIGKGNEKISNMVYKEYETLRKICKALLKSKGRNIFEENDVRLNGVLFDIDYLWKCFIYKNVLLKLKDEDSGDLDLMNSSLTTSNDFVIKHNGKEVEFVVGYNINFDDIKTNSKVVYYIYPEMKSEDTDDAVKEIENGIEICKMPYAVTNAEMAYEDFADYMKNKTKKMVKTINKMTCN